MCLASASSIWSLFCLLQTSFGEGATIILSCQFSKKINQNILGPNFFNTKLTRLLHLISFADLLPQCHASRETSHHICPTGIRSRQPWIKAFNISFWFDIKHVNLNLVTSAIFLNVSQNFNNIPQENEAVLWDVYRSEKLLEKRQHFYERLKQTFDTSRDLWFMAGV